MRILLLTGRGGVGRTTLAIRTATLAARRTRVMKHPATAATALLPAAGEQ